MSATESTYVLICDRPSTQVRYPGSSIPKCRGFCRGYARHKRPYQAVGIECSQVIVYAREDGGIGNRRVLSYGKVRYEGVKRESDEDEVIRRAKIAVVVARLDNLGGLNKDGLLDS